MKLHPYWLAALFVTPAFAIDAPVDDAPAPPLLRKGNVTAAPDRQTPANPGEQTTSEKTAFLGLVTAEVPDVLAEHLRLKIGEGIMVRALMPDGPAAKSGITVHDVILRVSGRSVGSPADLTQQIASRKVGETIQVELIHQGQPGKVDVTLGERPPQVAASAPQPRADRDPRPPFQGMPEAQAEQLRGLLDQQDSPDTAIEQMRERMERMLGAPQNSDEEEIPQTKDSSDGAIKMKSQAPIRIMDGQGSVEVKSRDDSKEITIHDTTGKVTWSGPWNTPEEQASAPQEVRDRVSRLNIDQNFQGNGLRFKLSPGFPGQR